MTFDQILSLAIGSMLIQNIVLTQFLGICPFLGVSKKRESAVGMGMAVIFVIIISSLAAYGLGVILSSLDLMYLRTIVFILVISALVQFVEMFVKKTAPALNKALGVYLPLITTNCAVLGTALKVVDEEFTLLETFIYSMFTAIGFAFIMYIFSSIREKLDSNPNIPRSFKGIPIALIVAATLAVIFSRYSGIV